MHMYRKIGEIRVSLLFHSMVIQYILFHVECISVLEDMLDVVFDLQSTGLYLKFLIRFLQLS